jgi:hypothetical protein
MKISKDRIALSMAENLKTFVEKAYPKDSTLIKQTTEIVFALCLKVRRSEEKVDAIC